MLLSRPSQSRHLTPVFSVILACLPPTLCESSINQDADPWIIKLDTPTGPDGPWNAMLQPVDWESQYLTMFPSLTPTSIFITKSSCSAQNSACVQGPAVLWSESNAHMTWRWTNSTWVDVNDWDASLEPMRLQGQGTYTADRITLEDLEDPSRALGFLDGTAIVLAENITVTYPQNSYYTLSSGFLSLDGGSDGVAWTSVNGSEVNYEPALRNAYLNGHIPSTSYGLQLGSASLGINGSLVLGGYDRSRCLTSPISSDTQTFQLLDIRLGVSHGGSAFLEMKDSTSGLLLDDSQSTSQLQVMPNPGVPYMYLPSSTCSAIARHLPVTFDSDLALYIWNTSDPSFERIMSSPHYLSFTFASGTTNSTIYVPFTLLNLTLTNPVVSITTQYFPCSPYTPADGTTYHLGRSFLQAAYLSQNWQTNTLLLSQAPGPSVASEDVFTIASTATTITPMVNAPAWNATWATKLRALAHNPTSSTSSASSPTPSTPSSSGLSGGAIAGIVIGVIALLALLAASIFLLLRRRRNKAGLPKPYTPTPSGEKDAGYTLVAPNELDAQPFTAEAPDGQFFEAPGHDVSCASRFARGSGQTGAIELEGARYESYSRDPSK